MDNAKEKNPLFAALRKPKAVELLDALSPRGSATMIASLGALVLKDPAILGCVPISVLQCATVALRLGLPLGEGGVYLTPRKVKKVVQGVETWELHAVPVIDYRALVELALEHPKIDAISSATIFEHDEFQCDLGDTRQPFRHVVDVRKPRGESIGAWACVISPSGHATGAVMSSAEIDAVCVPKRDGRITNPIWVKNRPEMERKSVLRRHLKTCPRSARYLMAERIEDAVDEGRPIEVPGLEDIEADPSFSVAPGVAPEPAAAASGAAVPARQEVRPQDPPERVRPLEREDRREEARPDPSGVFEPAPVRQVEAPAKSAAPERTPAALPRRSRPAPAAEKAPEPPKESDPTGGRVTDAMSPQEALGVLYAELDVVVLDNPAAEADFEEALARLGGMPAMKSAADIRRLWRETFNFKP